LYVRLKILWCINPYAGGLRGVGSLRGDLSQRRGGAEREKEEFWVKIKIKM